jgi:hypothetical protein
LGHPDVLQKIFRSDPIISWLRHNKNVVFLYVRLTDTLVPLVLALVIVVPVGTVLLLFYVPKFRRNWRRRKEYGVDADQGTTWSTE